MTTSRSLQQYILITQYGKAEQILQRNREALARVAARSGHVDAVFGVSEGADIAAQLAVENPGVRRLVVIGGGGLSLRQSLDILPARPAGRAAERARARDPASPSKRFLGLPYLYWSSFLDHDPLRAYLQVSQPTWVVHGEADESVPIASAYALRDAVARAGRTNFTFDFVGGASHTLVRDGRDLKPLVFADIDRWLERP
jgi:pimeloyl-ACP methyl ester carboxylesterase